jgi:hypothetical protein
VVCTAGINIETGEWRRVFPYPFRTVADVAQFEKYEIVEVDLREDNRDKRPESRHIENIESIVTVGQKISTKNNWQERLKFILPTCFESVAAMADQMIVDDVWGRTLAPVRVAAGSAKVTFEEDERDWNEKDAEKLERAESNLFRPPGSPSLRTLRKLPYRFRLSFEDMTGTRHKLLVLDWEIGVLFLNEVKRKGSEEAALESVRYKIEEQIFATTNDPYVILGNMNHQYKTKQLAVIGFVYPRRVTQSELGMDSLFS